MSYHYLRMQSGAGTSTRPDWRDQGLCATHPDPDLWFPVGSSDRYAQQLTEAKAVCARCPVITRCREWALARPDEAGVWGGLDEDDRRRIHRRHGRRRKAA